MKPDTDEESPLSYLKARQEPDAGKILDSLKLGLVGANGVEYYDRMEHNHWARHCWEPGQHRDGRKHVKEGMSPDSVFPWNLASDTRIPIVDEIINERVDIQMAAAKQATQQQRLMPRDLKAGEDAEAAAIAWGGVAAYYDDECQDNFYTELRKAVDWKEEWGHSFLRMAWLTERQMEKRAITGDEVLKMTLAVAWELARSAKQEKQDAMGQHRDAETRSLSGGDQDQEQEQEQDVQLTPEEQAEIEKQVSQQWEEMLMDKAMQDALIERLQAYDEDMPDSEATRVASALRKGEEAIYYAPMVVRSVPQWRALRPLLDGFCPPETVRVKGARWFTEGEWVTVVELEERVETRGWKQTAVDKAKEHKGKCFDPTGIQGLSRHDWVLSGGEIGFTTADEAGVPTEGSELVQVLHVYYLATCMGGVPALFHTVVHGQVTDELLYHECCEDAHAKYPVWDFVRETKAPSLLASRGVGEISFTQQQEMKIQRDMRADAASLTIMPPVLVPLVQAGGNLNIRPGRKIPRRSTGPGGGIEPIDLVGDTSNSVEVERACRESLNFYWQRGKDADPEIKRICRQAMVDACFTSIREVKRMTFQLIQQYAPEKIRASAIGGLPVNLEVSRADIQGEISLSYVFDVGDLDFDLVGKKLDMVAKVIRPLDTEGLLPVSDLLRTALTILMPSAARSLIRNPKNVTRDEGKDEDQALTQILCGIEPEYVPGKNHAFRLERLMTKVNETRPDGGPTMVQQILGNSTQVRQLLGKRLQFHLFQAEQARDNPEIGRLGVEPGPGNEGAKNMIAALSKEAGPVPQAA